MKFAGRRAEPFPDDGKRRRGHSPARHETCLIPYSNRTTYRFFGKNIFTKWLPPDPFHNSGSTLKPVRAVWKADTENGAVRGGAERQKLFTMLVLMKTRNNAVLAWSYFSEKKFLSESEKRACQGRGFSLEISSRRSGGIGRHARFRV